MTTTRSSLSVTLACAAVCLAALPAATQPQATPHPALTAWLERQAALDTWTADVVQTRSLAALTRPIETPGRVWFVQPDRFRWELGDPVRTIALRRADELLVVYPRLAQAERYPLSGEIDPAWEQALALLVVGFPRDPETFWERYRPVSAERQGDAWRFVLVPRSAEAQRLVRRVAFEVGAEDSKLRATELVFADESTLRNEFTERRENPRIDPGLLELDLEGYEVVSPLDR